jgi:O-antigen/teichoic acid export membrane protein
LNIQKNINASLVYQIGITLFNFLSILLITRILGEDGRGQVAVYNNAIALFTTIFSFSLGSGLVHFIANKKMTASIAIQQLVLMLVLVCCILLLLLGFLYLTNHQFWLVPFNKNSMYIIVFGAHVFLSICTIWLIALFNANNQFIKPLRIQFTMVLVQVFLLLLIYNGGWKLDAAMATSNIVLLVFTVYFVQVVFLLVYYIKQNPVLGFKFSTQFNHSLFGYSALAFVCNVVQIFCYRLDIWFLQAYQSHRVIAIYSIAAMCMQMLWILPYQISSVMFTKFSEAKDPTQITKQVASIHAIVFWISILVFGLSGVLGFWMIPLFFGNAYAASAPLLSLLLLGGIPLSSAMIISTFNASTNKLPINLKASAISLVFCIALNAYLIPIHSYYGAAIASAVTYLANCFYLWIQFCNANQIKITSLFLPSSASITQIKNTWHELQQS